MEGILARIHIQYKDGNDIAYFDEFDYLKELGLENKGYYGEMLIDVGDCLNTSYGNFRVVNIRTMYMPQTYPPNNDKGINVYGIGKQLAHNFMIIYEVVDK